MADKTKSIKSATDQELEALLVRLRKESEVQYLVSDLKRKSTPSNNFGTSSYGEYPDMSVSTEAPIESLYHDEIEAVLAHVGVKGMKWGHRKAQNHSDLSLLRRIMLKQAQKKAANAKAKQEMAAIKSDIKKSTLSVSEDHFRAKELKTKKVKQMSNAEIKQLNERMQLERTMRDLKASEVQKGIKFIKSLTDVGKTVSDLYNLTNTPMAKAIKESLGKKTK